MVAIYSGGRGCRSIDLLVHLDHGGCTTAWKEWVSRIYFRLCGDLAVFPIVVALVATAATKKPSTASSPAASTFIASIPLMSGMNLSIDAEVLPKAVRDYQPEWGIVLGSGLGMLVEEVDAILSLPYEEITGMPVSTVPGHAGRFVFGRLAGCRVLMAQGRVHLYEGRTAEEVTATVRFMENLGVRRLLLTNAAGTLHPKFAPGSWMMLSDHLNLTGTSPLVGGANFVDMSAVYTPELRARFARAAQEEGVALHEGVYAGLLGPQYETPAEVRMLRVLGADAVGMSTVLEAIQARALGMEVAGFSCLTNWAAGLSDQALSHEEVLAVGKKAAEGMLRVLARVLGDGREENIQHPTSNTQHPMSGA
jgi:purine-nucleoside phosphorylase